jgi:hypothetical protein
VEAGKMYLKEFNCHKKEFCKYVRFHKRRVEWNCKRAEWRCVGCRKTWLFADCPEFEKEVEWESRWV